jgi:hypothetical protein
MKPDFKGLIGGSNDCGDECMVISIVPFNGARRTLIRTQQILFYGLFDLFLRPGREQNHGYDQDRIRN